MNQTAFNTWMTAIDDQFLEEAQALTPHRSVRRGGVLAAVVCACLLLSVLLWPSSPEDAPADGAPPTLTNPIQSATAESLAQLGYALPLPTGAEDPQYALISMGTETPMAEIAFSRKGQHYTYRALHTEAAQDISGLYYDWETCVAWRSGGLDLELCAVSDAGWLGWYDAAAKTQYLLIGHPAELPETARALVTALGYNADTVPPEAPIQEKEESR